MSEQFQPDQASAEAQPTALVGIGKLVVLSMHAALRAGYLAGSTRERIKSANSGSVRTAAEMLLAGITTDPNPGTTSGQDNGGNPVIKLPETITEAVVNTAKPILVQSAAQLAIGSVGAVLRQIGQRGETPKHQLASAAADMLSRAAQS